MIEEGAVDRGGWCLGHTVHMTESTPAQMNDGHTPGYLGVEDEELVGHLEHCTTPHVGCMLYTKND